MHTTKQTCCTCKTQKARAGCPGFPFTPSCKGYSSRRLLNQDALCTLLQTLAKHHGVRTGLEASQVQFKTAI